MKDYRVLEGLIKNMKSELQTSYNKGYEHGYEDGKEEAKNCDCQKNMESEYQRGLNDAWDIVRRMEIALFDNAFQPIFGETDFYTVVTKKTVSEAMEKIREYEEKKKAVVQDFVNAVKRKECES